MLYSAKPVLVAQCVLYVLYCFLCLTSGDGLSHANVAGLARVSVFIQGVSGSLIKCLSLLLSLKINLVAQTGDIYFFLAAKQA